MSSLEYLFVLLKRAETFVSSRWCWVLFFLAPNVFLFLSVVAHTYPHFTYGRTLNLFPLPPPMGRGRGREGGSCDRGDGKGKATKREEWREGDWR